MRKQLKKTFSYYSLVYTMTEEQKKQCEKDFNANMKILRKAKSFKGIPTNKEHNFPIKFIYAGGIYLNRWKTLNYLAKEIKDINKYNHFFELHIYTSNEITKKINKLLNDNKNVFIHKAVSQNELENIYKNSDIALHVESFDLKNRLAVRMSFSTKIVDCLSSGCAVMAICDYKQSGFKYLLKENSAICISSKKDVRTNLEKILENPSILFNYISNAKTCCEKNHQQINNLEMIKKDFEYYSL